MSDSAQTMIDNLAKNTGKTIHEWVDIVKNTKIEKHGQIIKYLKESHNFTHGFANLVAHKARESDSGSVENKEDLIDKQYKGKENLKEIYNILLAEILKFGDDIEIAPKKASVSLRRKKQFALLQPATKTRFEIGLNVKNVESEGCLEYVKSKNSMCSHKIKIMDKEEITEEVYMWLKRAYQDAG